MKVELNRKEIIEALSDYVESLFVGCRADCTASDYNLPHALEFDITPIKAEADSK